MNSNGSSFRRSLSCGAAVLWLAGVPLFAQITNGSFEAGVSGWTFTGGLSIAGPPDLPPAVGVDGTRVASIGGGDIPNSTLSQAFPVAANTTYVLALATAAFGDNFPGRVGSVRVDLIAPDSSVLASRSFTNVSPGPSIGTNGFTRHTIRFRTPTDANFVTLKIMDTSPNGGVAVDSMIDDVRVDLGNPVNPDNLIVNGSFETPDVLLGNVYLPGDALPGWQTTDTSFEVWLDGSQAVDGVQHLEILAQTATATVWQTVTTIPGEDYALSFFHSARPTVDSTLSVAINGHTIAIFAENGSTTNAFQWHRFRTNFTASSNATTISFSDAALTAAGTHIDNVVLQRLPLLSTIRVSEVEICWPTVPAKVYQVEYRSALTTNLWANFGGPVQGNGTTNCIKDAVPAGEPQRFYRVNAVP